MRRCGGRRIRLIEGRSAGGLRYSGFVRAKTWIVCAVLGASPAACGTETASEGINAPCTRTTDCVDGLQCLGGFCDFADAGAPLDGNATADSNASDVLELE